MSILRYILRRLLSSIPLLFVIPLITFFLMHLVPGNYFDALRINPQVSPETVQKYESLYHLDKPFIIQYFYWVRNLLRLDFGYSFAYKQPVLKILGSRLGNTFLLSSVSFLIAWILAICFGLVAGLKRNGLFDRCFNFIAYLGLSIPNFLFCLIALCAVSHFGFLPTGGMRSVAYDDLDWIGKIGDIARHMVIPVFVLATGSFAFLFRLMRAQTLEILDQEFVLYLRSQRIPEWKLIFKHIARNAINPMVSLFGLELPTLFSGAALVEIFTGWPGLGQMMLQAVRAQDVFLVLGNLVMIALLLVIGNLLADILLVVMDPRIRLEG